jgi:hypothetical protein
MEVTVNDFFDVHRDPSFVLHHIHRAYGSPHEAEMETFRDDNHLDPV